MKSLSQFTKTLVIIILAIIVFGVLKFLCPEISFLDESTDSNTIGLDSIAQSYKNDSALDKPLELKKFYAINLSKRLEKRKPTLHIPSSIGGVIAEANITDTILDPTISIQGYGYLQHFFSKLNYHEKNSSSKLRIAYYGDSMNDGDLIVQDIRELFQDKFGGNGVGMVSITSMSSQARGSVVHKVSSNWRTQSFVSTKKPSVPFGVDGQVFLNDSNTESWVSYVAGNKSTCKSLPNPTLFYGSSSNKNGTIKVQINKNIDKEFSLNGSSLLNTKSLEVGSAQSIKVVFDSIKSVPIYGFDFSGYSGVYVDNFSLRGNSGLPLSSFDTSLINSFNYALKYDLIVLQYGTNVLNYGSLDYSWYERAMTNVITKLRACFPNTDILIISVGDKSSKKNMEMETDAAVLPLVNAQKRFARNNGVGFLDLYNLMGGENSMVEWVNNGKANKDYTHFNIKGSKDIGVLIYDEIIKSYGKYKSQLAYEYTK